MPKSTDGSDETGTTSTGASIPAAPQAPAPAESNGADAAAERPPVSEISGVRFKHGQTDRRRFSTTDLIGLGAESPKQDIEFSSENGWTVPMTELNASTVDALIKMPEFSVV